MVGDWDGDGIDSSGFISGNSWHLRNSLTSGGVDRSILLAGTTSGTPIVGDWDGDGDDGVGVVIQESTRLRWYLLSDPASGSFDPDIVISYGGSGTPVVGDWDGDGVDTPGVVRGKARFLKSSLAGGAADVRFGYGAATDVPLVGDWDGDGVDTPGIARSSHAGVVWALRNTNAAGPGDIRLIFGP